MVAMQYLHATGRRIQVRIEEEETEEKDEEEEEEEGDNIVPQAGTIALAGSLSLGFLRYFKNLGINFQ